MSRQFDMRKIYHADPQNLWFFRILVLVALGGIYVCLVVLGIAIWPITDQLNTIVNQMNSILQQ